MTQETFDADVIVIGAGAAGLAGATTLARARRSVLAIDAGEPRNAPAAGVHGFLSRDGVPPGELLAAGRAELASYGGRVLAGVASSARALDGGFEVGLGDGSSYTARRLLVTTGAVDELPDVPGLVEHWGGAVVHCPYCHGWEVRDRPIAVLATSPAAIAHAGLLWSQWTDDLTVLLHEQPEPEPETAAKLAAAGVRVVPGRIERVRSVDGKLAGVEVAGARIDCEAVVVPTFVRARSAVLESLGVEVLDLEMGSQAVATHVGADPVSGLTSVPGVYVAGNVANPMGQVITAAASGVMAGAVINMDLVEADVAGVRAGSVPVG